MASSALVIPASTTASSWAWLPRSARARRRAAATALSKRSVRSYVWRSASSTPASNSSAGRRSASQYFVP
ncbi:MAG: hypothetical protein ACYCVO_07605 [Acidimicrobiales bacterium]